MLRIGLTGGIGAGKSTVARRLVELGATLVDADVVAREVVEPGSEGLAQVVAEFGSEVLDADGALDRPALGSIVFGDPAALTRLNGILHPLIGRRTMELVERAPEDGVLVQDIPLLVEGTMAPLFALVIVVNAAEDERVRRLVGDRGMSESEARARIGAQATDDARRAAADVWLDNSGSPDQARDEVDRLWRDRLLPFEENVRLGRPGSSRPPRLVEPDASWPVQYERLAARIGHAVGDAALRVDHIGSTAIPGLPAKDVLDIQLTVKELSAVDVALPALRGVGFIDRPGVDRDNPKPADPDPEHWRKRFLTSADPARPVNLHVRAEGSPGARYALLFRDWLRADRRARDEYLTVKRRAAERHAGDSDASRYVEEKEPWFDEALPKAEQWAQNEAWRNPTDGLL
ncbi:dephospho-CoA kinase [Pseudonocardia spinosispora]|uniref:dephospho-CoA kinase n=1 Tax=Pseudonocardia spinosispora TaxID=103441 RepID=UPI0004122188|nr:dephospho-CoA kinase [Pseudonocardia spinosispora]